MILNEVEEKVGHVVARGYVLAAGHEYVLGVDFVGRLDALAIEHAQLGQFEQYSQLIVVHLLNGVVGQVELAQDVQLDEMVDVAELADLVVREIDALDELVLLRYSVHRLDQIVGQVDRAQHLQAVQAFDYFDLV